MIKNYLTIALRNLTRQPGYTLINVLGLAVGLACFMIIMMYLVDEMSYDKWHKNGDPIGKTLDIPQNDNDLLVRGICQDIPENTHFDHRLYQFYESRNGQIGEQS